MKILICGATGFLGRNCTNYFASLGHEVHAVRFTRPEYECAGVTWHQADLRQPNAIDYHGYDVVLQLAAGSSGVKDTLATPALHVTNNIVMNAYILKEASEAGVGHVIFPSCSVMLPNGHNDESVEPKIRKEYLGFASQKILCEKLCEFYSNISSTKFTVIRNSNFFGPYDKFDLEHSHVAGATITKVMTLIKWKDKKETLKIWGTGEEGRDLVYVSDFCRFVEKVIPNQPSKFALYNCGSGTATTINDLVKKVIDNAPVEKDGIYIEHDLSAPSIPTSLSLDCGKAAREIGWTPQVSLDEGIKHTIEWWLANVGK